VGRHAKPETDNWQHQPSDIPPAIPERLVVTATGTFPRVKLDDPPEWPPLPLTAPKKPRFADSERPAPQTLQHDFVGDWGYKPIVPDRLNRGGRLFATMMFWFALAASVELWWLDTPRHSVRSVADYLTEGGRVAGIVAGFLLLTQMLAMSRVGWLERWIGAKDLLVWHRRLGAGLVFTVLIHVTLITFGYAGENGVSVFAQTRALWTSYIDMISAYIAASILALVGILAIRAIRRRMSYELWYYLHLATYVVLLLAYGHQFAEGQELSTDGFGHWYWVSLYVLVLACLAWGRVIRPIWLNGRHRLRIMEVVTESDDMVSIYITGRRIEDLDARAGQYFRWRFVARGCWWQAHPFSLSAAPNGRWLRLTVKAVGNHTRNLANLTPGTRVIAEGPWGVFTAEHRRRPAALLIAGGSGIAPIRALLEELPVGTIVVYRASALDEIVFRDELEWLAAQRNARLWFVLGSRHDEGPKRVFTERGMSEIAPDIRHRDVYLCGPVGLVEASLEALKQLRVRKSQIHIDPFEF
jgi:predicted ferric reductase